MIPILTNHNGIVASTISASLGDTEDSYFAVTVPSGKVDADLTGYPLYIDLSDMPSGFWDDVDVYGFKIRAYNSSDTAIPMDLVFIDKTAETGCVFVKTDIASGSDTVVRIRTDGSGRVSPTSLNGREAVWSDYDSVTMFGFDAADRTGNGQLRGDGDANRLTGTVLHTFTEDPHQGGTFDGTHYYIVDTNAIYKFDLSWTLVASNVDPIGDTGLPTVNHLGDPCVRNGVLYIPLEYYSTGVSSDQHIVRFSTDTLSYLSAFDVSAGDHEASSICYCPVDNYFYITDYIAGEVHKWTSTFTYVGEFSINGDGTKFQGIEWYQEGFWIVDDELDEVFRVSYNGQTMNQVSTSTINGYFGQPVTGNLEGIFVGPNGLCVLSDPSAANSFITEYTITPTSLMVDQGWIYTGGGQTVELETADRSVFTMGCSGRISVKGVNRCLMTYHQFDSDGTPNDRMSISYQESTTQMGVWDDLNLWLFCSTPFNPGTSDYFRMHAIYNGTTHRKIYVNGVLQNTSGAISVHDNNNRLGFGREDMSGNEPWQGEIGYGYLRNGILPDAWLKAEYDNMNDGTFYSVAAITV